MSCIHLAQKAEKDNSLDSYSMASVYFHKRAWALAQFSQLRLVQESRTD